MKNTPNELILRSCGYIHADVFQLLFIVFCDKFQAIGLRMSVTNEAEGRTRQKRALQTVINEKRAELDRINAQLQSLERIESEQRATIEKFTNSQS